MAQGLRHRPARTRRFGIGAMLLGAALGCHNTDKAPMSKLPPIPPPKLPSEAAQPGARGSAPAPVTTRQAESAAPPANTIDPSTAFPPGMGSQMGTVAAPPSPVNPASFNGPTTLPATTTRSSQSPTITAPSPAEGTIPPFPPHAGLADPTPPAPPPARGTATPPPTTAPIATPEMPTDKAPPSGGASGGIIVPSSLSK